MTSFYIAKSAATSYLMKLSHDATKSKRFSANSSYVYSIIDESNF